MNIGRVLRILVWVSVLLYFAELATGTENSLESGASFFLWTERVIACIFIVEYGTRIVQNEENLDEGLDDYNPGFGRHYVFSFMGFADLIAFVPFLVGFFVPVEYLGLIRTLRVLRLLKLIRYNRSLQVMMMGFMRSWKYIKPMMFTMAALCMFTSAIIYETEHKVQPDSFGNIGDAAWFSIVSVTTVGYGDRSPITPLGKFAATATLLIPGILVFSAIVGVVGGMFQAVVEEECKRKEIVEHEKINDFDIRNLY